MNVLVIGFGLYVRTPCDVYLQRRAVGSSVWPVNIRPFSFLFFSPTHPHVPVAPRRAPPPILAGKAWLTLIKQSGSLMPMAGVEAEWVCVVAPEASCFAAVTQAATAALWPRGRAPSLPGIAGCRLRGRWRSWGPPDSCRRACLFKVTQKYEKLRA